MSIIFRCKINLCQAEAGAHCSHPLWAIYMAVRMPGHGDLTALLCPEKLYRDALATNCIDPSRGRAFGTNSTRMTIFCPSRVVCKKTHENISELS